MTTPDSGARFSWMRGLLHALLAAVAVTVAGGVLFAILSKPGSDARKFGEAVGRWVVITAVVAFGISWLRQTGRRRTAFGAALGYAVLIGLAVGGAMVVSRGRTGGQSAALTPAESVPMVTVDQGGERRLRHPAFRFSLLHPGPELQASPDLAMMMEGKKRDPATQHFAFADPGGSVVLISVMKGLGGTRASLTEHVDGLQGGFSGTPAGGTDLRWLSKEITWDDARHEAHLKASLGGDARLEFASYAVTRAGQPPFIVNVMVMSRDIARFAKLLSSFRSE